MDLALDPVATLLLHRLKSLYYWLQQRPHRANALDDPSRSRDHSINTSLGGASYRFGENWHALLPSERELVVDRLLAAYCITRTPREDFLWDKLNFKRLCLAVQSKDPPKESALAVMDTQASPYIQISNLVRATRNLCIESCRTDALNACTTWDEAFLSLAGIMRGKLYRLEPDVQRQVVQEVLAVFIQVSERLRTGHAIDDVLLSADTVFSSAHAAFEHASTRFSTFVSSLDSLIVLYTATPSHEADAALLRAARQSFERRMTLFEVPAVVESRTAEVHFAALSIEQQVQAVARARALLYHVCSQVHARRELLDAHQVRAELLNAIEHPQLMQLVRDARAVHSNAPH